MKYIKFFEELNSNYEELMGKLLHLYGSIPLSKHKSQEVIKRILIDNARKNKIDDPFFSLENDTDINLNLSTDRIRVRFSDFFDSLIESKEIRGHCFEGLIAGLFNGTLSTDKTTKWDVMIDGKTWSIKYIDRIGGTPEIGSFLKLSQTFGLYDVIMKYKGFINIFKSVNIKLKNDIFNKLISNSITGGWIIAYSEDDKLVLNVIDLETMKYDILFNGLATAPKRGSKSFFSLALSATYKKYSKKINITIPRLTLDELKKIYYSDEEVQWSKNIFGDMYNKIRPEVLRYIKSNREKIGKDLLDNNIKDKY